MNTGGIELVQLSDTHLYSAEAGALLGVNTRASLAGVLSLLAREGLDGHELVVTGDLVHDETAAGYRCLRDMLAGYRASFIPGNHDDPQLIQQLLPGAVIGSQVLDRGHWRLLLLNSACPGEVWGRLGDGLLDWLRRQLSDPGPAHALICLHHPPVAVGCAWLDALGLKDGEALLELARASGRVRGIVFGHIHQSYDQDHHGVRLLGVPSTCAQFLPGAADFATDPAAAPGCRWIRCRDDGQLETRVLRDESGGQP